MGSQEYKHPPIGIPYLGHTVGAALMGALLPKGDYLILMHSLIWPIVSWIPNVVRLTVNAPDPVFAQVFIGLSLIASTGILGFYCFFMGSRGYRTRTFNSAWHRVMFLSYMWVVLGTCLAILWVVPYVGPASKGRAYFLFKSATASDFGVVVVMNQLVVGLPFMMLLALWIAHACTGSRSFVGVPRRVEL
ncbi:hypothetical protein [Ramlibacter rhizophilus]|uniref:Uncharacterized protein n=1 Tax=Ramlibacter rhizophilus TaxID=1781167 RepID=A0A4Z0BEA4_9BURK|nr:hypothetical protein [Ramlibacter rhizophilus]TFY96444.1 hypothetical protein EZ242_20670 [Ramlibacter rhizophilus]